ncbi:MAG TPA: hypothetical protein VFJ72_10960 [Rubrobacteraceae bacterium]|nr:hypothetical protein [Rubrobacteraceae bacterium]
MRKLTILAVMLTMALMAAAPASADTVTADGLIAGTLEGGVVVAGNPNLANGAPTLSLGDDVAAAGSQVPPDAFAGGFNIPFTVNVADAGVGTTIEDDVIAGSAFLDTNFVEAGSGSLSVDTQVGFLD